MIADAAVDTIHIASCIAQSQACGKSWVNLSSAVEPFLLFCGVGHCGGPSMRSDTQVPQLSLLLCSLYTLLFTWVFINATLSFLLASYNLALLLFFSSVCLVGVSPSISQWLLQLLVPYGQGGGPEGHQSFGGAWSACCSYVAM